MNHTNRTEIPLSFCNELAQCDSPGGVGDSALISGRYKVITGKQAGLGFYQGPLYPNITSTDQGTDKGCPAGCLFDIFADPSETQDLREELPGVFQRMMSRLDQIGLSVFQTNYSVASHCASPAKAMKKDHGFLAPRCT